MFVLVGRELLSSYFWAFLGEENLLKAWNLVNLLRVPEVQALLFSLAANIYNIEKDYKLGYAIALHLYFAVKAIQLTQHARNRKVRHW